MQSNKHHFQEVHINIKQPFLDTRHFGILSRMRRNKSTRCDPSQRHAWEKWRMEKQMGAMSEGGSARCRVLQGGVTGSHGFTSHFIACYKITGGHRTLISHQTSSSHAISFIRQGSPTAVMYVHHGPQSLWRATQYFEKLRRNPEKLFARTHTGEKPQGYVISLV